MPRRLYLVRHGETNANVFKIVEGGGSGALSYGGGSHLSRKGLSQANLLGCALTNVKIHHAYISPSRRTIETADSIFSQITPANRPIITLISDFIEINFGVLEGLDSQKARKEYPDLFKIYHDKPSQTEFPGGESVAGACGRVSGALDKILAANDHGENVLIVSHGAVMTFIFINIFNLDLDTMFHAIRHHNCGLSIIEWWTKNDSPKIVCMNDISHLKDEYSDRLK